MGTFTIVVLESDPNALTRCHAATQGDEAMKMLCFGNEARPCQLSIYLTTKYKIPVFDLKYVSFYHLWLIVLSLTKINFLKYSECLSFQLNFNLVITISCFFPVMPFSYLQE